MPPPVRPAFLLDVKGPQEAIEGLSIADVGEFPCARADGEERSPVAEGDGAVRILAVHAEGGIEEIDADVRRARLGAQAVEEEKAEGASPLLDGEEMVVKLRETAWGVGGAGKEVPEEDIDAETRLVSNPKVSLREGRRGEEGASGVGRHAFPGVI